MPSLMARSGASSLLLLLFVPLLLNEIDALPSSHSPSSMFSCDYPKLVPSASLVHSTLQNREILHTCPSASLFHVFYSPSDPVCVSCTGGGSFFWTHRPTSPPASVCLPKPLYSRRTFQHVFHSASSRPRHSGIHNSSSHSLYVRSNLLKRHSGVSLSNSSTSSQAVPNNTQISSNHKNVMTRDTLDHPSSYDSCRRLDCSDSHLPFLQYPHCPSSTFCNITTSSCQPIFTAKPPCSPMLYSTQLQKCVSCHTSSLMPSPLLKPKYSFTGMDYDDPPHTWIASYRCDERGEFAMPLDNINWETIKKTPQSLLLICILVTSLLVISFAFRQHPRWHSHTKKG